jgi:hypothetical protein
MSTDPLFIQDSLIFNFIQPMDNKPIPGFAPTPVPGNIYDFYFVKGVNKCLQGNGSKPLRLTRRHYFHCVAHTQVWNRNSVEVS